MATVDAEYRTQQPPTCIEVALAAGETQMVYVAGDGVVTANPGGGAYLAFQYLF